MFFSFFTDFPGDNLSTGTGSLSGKGGGNSQWSSKAYAIGTIATFYIFRCHLCNKRSQRDSRDSTGSTNECNLELFNPLFGNRTARTFRSVGYKNGSVYCHDSLSIYRLLLCNGKINNAGRLYTIVSAKRLA